MLCTLVIICWELLTLLCEFESLVNLIPNQLPVVYLKVNYSLIHYNWSNETSVTTTTVQFYCNWISWLVVHVLIPTLMCFYLNTGITNEMDCPDVIIWPTTILPATTTKPDVITNTIVKTNTIVTTKSGPLATSTTTKLENTVVTPGTPNLTPKPEATPTASPDSRTSPVTTT